MSRRNAADGGGSGSGGNVKRDDYCTYVMGIERKTSMCDGPHFPNLQAAFKSKADQEQQQHRPGLFQHLESFEERLSGGQTKRKEEKGWGEGGRIMVRGICRRVFEKR